MKARNTINSPPKFILEKKSVYKTLKEQKYGRHNQIQVHDSVMREEGINTPHICCTQQEPFS